MESLGRTFLEAHSGCWQSPVTCNCRSEVSARVCSSASVSHTHSFSRGLLLSQSQPQFCPPAKESTQVFRLGVAIDSVKNYMCLFDRLMNDPAALAGHRVSTRLGEQEKGRELFV